MEQLTDEIIKVSTKIDALEELLKKPFKTWTEEEKEEFGNEDLLGKEKEQLREEKQELLKQKTSILMQRDQNQTEITAASKGIVEQSTETNQKPSKFLYSSGPVDPKTNYAIPFEKLPWAMNLIQAVDAKQAVLLHGHWQSGKTSALRFIKSRAEEQGIKVYYLDMMGCISDLNRYILDGRSIFHFLAWAMSGLSETLPNFSGAYDFCKWSEARHQGIPPILLFDECDAFLQVSRKNQQLLHEINSLISLNRNTQSTFSSIVCAGTFSIVATQSGDVGDMDVVLDADLKKWDSDDSLDAVVRPFGVVSPWNKCLFIETQPFGRQLFKDFAVSVSEGYNTSIEAEVFDEILETTCGHPGFSIWMLIKSIQQAIQHKCLTIADWMNLKRIIYNEEFYNSPTMLKMVRRVKSSKKIAGVLHVLVRDNQVKCSEVRLVSFLRAVGIAKPSFHAANFITFTSPIIRDCLLQKLKFYRAYDTINEIATFCDPTPVNYIQTILLKALSHIKAAEILDPLVAYSKGLAEAAVHAELYRILHAFFRNHSVAVLTETRVVSSSDMCYDIWMKTEFAEFGLELKTECDNSYIQEKANPQIVKYASSREPREMVLLNFVMKEAASVTFPINIKPIGWDKYPKTAFSVLFVKVMGDVNSGLKFCYASDGDTCWSGL
ncbi:hypothetical protein BC833DRAFT_625755 [Globomyces pollinis-pini]|nr:hypothetical protein BC833DRAFT_625755 [Globomyces pollinis-pini]